MNRASARRTLTSTIVLKNLSRTNRGHVCLFIREIGDEVFTLASVNSMLSTAVKDVHLCKGKFDLR